MFSDEKATAMAAYFLERATDHRLNDLRLMKLLYLSERESLRRFTAPITDSTLFSMKNGPVLSEVLDLYYGKGNANFWLAHIGFLSQRRGEASENTIYLVKELDPAEHLSNAEIKILSEVWEQYKSDGKWNLVKLTHVFPEWDKDAKIYDTSIRLRERTIFEQGFKDDPETAAAKVQDLEYYREIAA